MNNFLFYSEGNYSYTRGVLTNHNMNYVIYDLQNGEKLTLEKVFIVSKIGKINKILKEIVNNDEWLKQQIFEVEQVTVVNNFTFDQNEIIFMYNPKEIAPYEIGEIEIPIYWSEIKDCIKPWFKQIMSIK